MIRPDDSGPVTLHCKPSNKRKQSWLLEPVEKASRMARAQRDPGGEYLERRDRSSQSGTRRRRHPFFPGRP